VFYRARDWLDTSPATQLTLARAAIRAWEGLAQQADARAAAGGMLSVRERHALHAVDCLSARPDITPEVVRAAIQAIVAGRPDGVWAHFSDLAGHALDQLCGPP
jgi:hypothetical protein